jgi:hypothetical protein
MVRDGNLTMTDAIGGSVQDTIVNNLIHITTNSVGIQDAGPSQSSQDNGAGPSPSQPMDLDEPGPEPEQMEFDGSVDEMHRLKRVLSHGHLTEGDRDDMMRE